MQCAFRLVKRITAETFEDDGVFCKRWAAVWVWKWVKSFRLTGRTVKYTERWKMLQLSELVQRTGYLARQSEEDGAISCCTLTFTLAHKQKYFHSAIFLRTQRVGLRRG